VSAGHRTLYTVKTVDSFDNLDEATAWLQRRAQERAGCFAVLYAQPVSPTGHQGQPRRLAAAVEGELRWGDPFPGMAAELADEAELPEL